jgi:hypothetical protein
MVLLGEDCFVSCTVCNVVFSSPPSAFFKTMIITDVCVFAEGEFEVVMVRLAAICTECWRCVWERIDV